MNGTQNVTDVLNRWAAAEVAGDVDELSAISAGDFLLVGPAGYMLAKEQWLDRYRGGGMNTERLDLEDVEVSERAATAATVAIMDQSASYQEHRADGRFRVTHHLVDDGAGWVLLAVHVGPLAPPADPRTQR